MKLILTSDPQARQEYCWRSCNSRKHFSCIMWPHSFMTIHSITASNYPSHWLHFSWPLQSLSMMCDALKCIFIFFGQTSKKNSINNKRKGFANWNVWIILGEFFFFLFTEVNFCFCYSPLSPSPAKLCLSRS